MDTERDPTDLGIRYAEPVAPPDPEPEPPPGPPASPDHVAAVLAAAAEQLGWKRGPARARLQERCRCGAAPGSWCNRPRRGTSIGFVHEYRGAEVTTPPV